jgi:hypothetical protein
MKRRAERLFSKSTAAKFAACGFVLLLAGSAAAQQQQPSSRPHKPSLSAAGQGDIVVHTGRNITYTPNPSYNQNPYQSFLAGTYQHYYADTALAGSGQVYSFGQTSTLPSRFDPPGQVEPLFRF